MSQRSNKVINVPFNRWLGFMFLNLVGLGILYSHGVFGLILAADITFLSWIIMLVYLLTSLSIGRKTYNYSFGKLKGIPMNTNVQWFVRDELANVGLIGTIIGLMLILGPAFAAIDPSLASSITEALSYISLGVGTALWTTVTALVSSVFLGFQLVNLERAQKSM